MTTAVKIISQFHADKNHRSGAGPWASKTARVARLAPIGSADARHLASARWRSPLTGGIGEKIPPGECAQTIRGSPRDDRRADRKTKYCMKYGTWTCSARLDGHA